MKQEATTPQAESPNSVGKCQPQRHKHHPRPYIHPPQHRPRQQNHRHRREHALEPYHRRHRIKWRDHRCFHRAILIVMRCRRQRRLL